MQLNKDTLRATRLKVGLSQTALAEALGVHFRTVQNWEKGATIRVAEDWVIENQSDNGRFPNENEWRRFCSSPLDGKITMSFALQWRYNFGSIFKISKEQHKTSLLDL